MTIWRLKKGSERKFRSGHPWVFSNELAHSPKGALPGELIELRDYAEHFLAVGYGHPNSLISFRVLSRARVAIDSAFLTDRLKKASALRRLTGVHGFSHRLCFAEGDGLPGLVIDRYRTENPGGQVFVLQSSTAGMDRILTAGWIFEALENLVESEMTEWGDKISWNETSIVISNDSKSRAMEGISAEPKRVERSASGFNPEHVLIQVQPGIDGMKPSVFSVDLVGGQKTGFFLDQRLNVQMASKFVSGLVAPLKSEQRELRVLDLCCYVGQWGTQLAHLASSAGVKAHVTLVDASTRALEIAAQNVERHGGVAKVEKMDVMQDLGQLANQSYDVVICDPPAFIKKKKDLPTGTNAYFKLNREAIRKVKPGGLFVSCSCSGLFTEEEFRSMLAKVVSTYDREVRWFARGSHSPDHPQRPEFPQGTYLKSWMGTVV